MRRIAHYIMVVFKLKLDWVPGVPTASPERAPVNLVS